MRHHVPLTRTLASVALIAVSALTGCDTSTVPADPELTSADANAIAAFMVDMDALALAAANLASSTGTRSFTRTAPCPAGGSVSASGSSESSTNEETKVVSVKWSNTHGQVVQPPCGT